MSTRLRTRSWLILGSVFLLLTPSDARKRQHWGEGFSVDLDQPYDQVLRIVQQVTNDGIIRGTYQYKGTNQLDGAESVKTSPAFPKWTGGGTVLYKVRPNTLAPENFYQSGDKGTVAVRYIVQPERENQPQPPPTTGGLAQYVALSKPRVFSAPEEHSSILLRAQSEDEFEVLERRGAWVRLGLGDNHSGWVKSSQVVLTPPTPATASVRSPSDRLIQSCGKQTVPV